MSIPHFRIPLNLPHAGTIAGRIGHILGRTAPTPATDTTVKIFELLLPCLESGENPPGPEAQRVRDEAAQLARRLVAEIEEFELAGDRLGQCVRNLFECLELGEEGAVLSLRAGEDPNSIQRPI